MAHGVVPSDQRAMTQVKTKHLYAFTRQKQAGLAYTQIALLFLPVTDLL